ncbi:hypothetical protein DL96DRAFT_1748004 [Flagelloscypha sp. PMI_526]|nr:hypothetical protein DL96DRAFT_1748004 [Flagelloscypha sp. PMI_526]
MLDGSIESNASPTTIAEEPSSPSTSQPPIQQTIARGADPGMTGEAQSAGRLNMFGFGLLDALPSASPIPPTIPSSVAAYATNNAPSLTNDDGNTYSGTGGAKGQVAMVLQNLPSTSDTCNSSFQFKEHEIVSSGPSSEPLKAKLVLTLVVVAVEGVLLGVERWGQVSEWEWG